jgi:hypothetical protein
MNVVLAVSFRLLMVLQCHYSLVCCYGFIKRGIKYSIVGSNIFQKLSTVIYKVKLWPMKLWHFKGRYSNILKSNPNGEKQFWKDGLDGSLQWDIILKELTSVSNQWSIQLSCKEMDLCCLSKPVFSYYLPINLYTFLQVTIQQFQRSRLKITLISFEALQLEDVNVNTWQNKYLKETNMVGN